MHEINHYPELPFAGFFSFLKAPIVAPQKIPESAQIGVIGVPFDGGISYRPGARYGPAAIRRSSSVYAYFNDYKGGLVNVDSSQTVDYDDLALLDFGDIPTVPNDIEQTREIVRQSIEFINGEVYPVILGGDHYITFPAFEGVANALDREIGLIQLDAHTDTTHTSPIYGEHFHATPMARIHESQFGSPDHHAILGIRGYEAPGIMNAAENDSPRIFTLEDIRANGIRQTIDEAISFVSEQTDDIYLTIDIDVTDPAYAPGTGTPEPGGLTSRELLTASTALGACNKIRAIDLMEIAPTLDQSDRTATLGARTLLHFLERKFL